MEYEDSSSKFSQDAKTISVVGIVSAGHGVASGKAQDSPFGKGTIALQSPFFEELGIPMNQFFSATINVDISPLSFDLPNWDYEALQLRWTDVIPPEDFYFSHCKITHLSRTHDALIYRPSPATKVDHFQKCSIIEILAPKLDKLKYGDTVKLLLNADHCSVT
jgi:hypothetical protein